MKSFPWDLVVLALVLAMNRLGTPATFFRPAAFWAIQVVDLVLAALVAVYGLPGLAGFPSVKWLVAGLLAFHVLQNVALRSQAVMKKEREATERERLRKLRALEPPKADGGPTDPPAEP